MTHLPGIGFARVGLWSDGAVRILLTETARLKDIPADLLELWVQVAARGELAPDGSFTKWDEATWERKRRELVGKPAPIADFPFPGHVATDKLHWLRQEFKFAAETEKPRLAKQLLDRAEVAGDNTEAMRWRAVLAPKADPPASK